MALITGPFALAAGTERDLADPRVPPFSVGVQLQNTSGFPLVVSSAGRLWSIPALDAVTIPVSPGLNVRVLPSNSVAAVVGNNLTAVWLRDGEVPAAPDGPLSTTTPTATTVAFVQLASANNSGAGTTTVTLGAASKVGDLLVVIGTNGQSANISSVSGGGGTWARAWNTNAGAGEVEIWWSVCTVAATSFTVTWAANASTGQATVLEFSGPTSVAGKLLNSAANSGPITTGALSAAGTVWVGGAYGIGATTMAVSSAGWTQAGATADAGSGGYLVAASSPQTAAFTAGGTVTTWGAVIVAFA